MLNSLPLLQSDVLEHRVTSDRAVPKDSILMHIMHSKTLVILRAGGRSVSAELQCILEASAVL